MSAVRPAFKPGSLLFRFQEGGLVLVILALGILLSVFGGSVSQLQTRVTANGEAERVVVQKNKFFNPRSLTQLAKDTSFFAIMAIGATFVIISGGIDLSVGAIYALASVLGATVLRAAAGSHLPFGIGAGILVCLGAAMVCGLINGAMIVSLGVHPFIITLGTMAIFRGVAFVITNGQSIGDFPQGFQDFVRHEIGGLSLVPLLVMVAMTAAGGIYLSRMTAGRRIYAVGGNEVASRYSGLRVERVKLSVYVISGLTAGVAALLAIGYYGSGSSGDGQGYELNVIAAAVVGGASLSGGKGSALGALLGALVIQMISTGIVILGIDQNYSQIIIGGVVILAVVFDKINAWAVRRRQTKFVS